MGHSQTDFRSKDTAAAVLALLVGISLSHLVLSQTSMSGAIPDLGLSLFFGFLALSVLEQLLDVSSPWWQPLARTIHAITES
jgi:hypothetical protein